MLYVSESWEIGAMQEKKKLLAYNDAFNKLVEKVRTEEVYFADLKETEIL